MTGAFMAPCLMNWLGLSLHRAPVWSQRAPPLSIYCALKCTNSTHLEESHFRAPPSVVVDICRSDPHGHSLCSVLDGVAVPSPCLPTACTPTLACTPSQSRGPTALGSPNSLVYAPCAATRLPTSCCRRSGFLSTLPITPSCANRPWVQDPFGSTVGLRTERKWVFRIRSIYIIG